ncbi:MAG: hypothetical protein K1V95_07800 [Eubacterium sp.]
MEITFKNIVFRLDFSFMILLSFAVLYGYQNAVDIILFSALHETGHLVMLLIFGVKPKKITLSFYGAGLKYNNTLSKSREFFVLLCGPLVNLILFVVFKNEINLLLFLLNIFPAAPLDGGRMIKLLFPKISSAVTVLFLILLTGLSCYLMFEFKIFSLLLIALYLITFNLKDMRG